MKIVRSMSVLLLLWAGCGALEDPIGVDGDGGVAGMDGGAGFGEAGPAPNAGEFDSFGARGCSDGLDNNSDGLMDCADPSCRTNLPSCCVGVADATCCVPGTPVDMGIASCTDGVSSCANAAGFDLFGARSPAFSDITEDGNAVVPNGDELIDSGAVAREPIDPRAGDIVLTAQIAMGERVDGELETLGFGLLDASVSMATPRAVAPRVGAVLTRNRRALMLMVNGERVDSVELNEPTPIDYTLRVRADGGVSLTFAGLATPLVATMRLDEPVRAAFWGRTPATADAAPRLLAFTVAQDRCDMPNALMPGPIVVPAPSDPDPTWPRETLVLSRPHVLRFNDGTERTWMALNADGNIHVAEPGGGGFIDAVGDRVLEPVATTWAEDGLDYPKLRYTDDGGLELWFTGYDARGHGTVGIARWDEVRQRFVDPMPVDGLSANARWSYEGAAPFESGGQTYAAVRVSDDDGHRLALYLLTPDAPAMEIAVLTAPRPDEPSAFDRDEVDAPAVVQIGGIYRLYYGARLGSRWSIALLVSDDGIEWRAPLGVIAGGGTGFDVLGRRDPAPFVADEQLQLYYAGSDGVFTRIGVLDGPSPE